MMEVSARTHHCLGFTFFRDCSTSRSASFSTAAWNTWEYTSRNKTVTLLEQVAFLRLTSQKLPCYSPPPRSFFGETKSMVFFRMRRSHESFSCLLWWIMGCVRTVQEECAALISLDSTLSSWICFLATRLFPVLIPKSPRLYSRFPSFLCGGRMKPGIRPQGSFRLNGLE